MKKFMKNLEKVWAAVAFAEADCHKIALDMLDDKSAVRNKKTLASFLDDVGLSNTNVTFGLARI